MWFLGQHELKTHNQVVLDRNRRIFAGVIVHIFAHSHTALRKEGSMVDTKCLQAAKELENLSTW